MLTCICFSSLKKTNPHYMKDGDRGMNYTLVEPILKCYDKYYIQRFQQTFHMQIFAGVRLFIGPKPISPPMMFFPFPPKRRRLLLTHPFWICCAPFAFILHFNFNPFVSYVFSPYSLTFASHLFSLSIVFPSYDIA
jgi:hypothetical protein